MALEIFKFTFRRVLKLHVLVNSCKSSLVIPSILHTLESRTQSHGHSIWFIQEQWNSEDQPEKIRVRLPKHIHSRWRKFLKCDGERFYYQIGKALKAENINKEKFAKCWKFVRSRTMPDEVFSWFKDAGFGQVTRRPARISLTVAFVRKILQRYKEVEVYV